MLYDTIRKKIGQFIQTILSVNKTRLALGDSPGWPEVFPAGFFVCLDGKERRG